MNELALKISPFEEEKQYVEPIVLVYEKSEWRTNKKNSVKTNWYRWLPHILSDRYEVISQRFKKDSIDFTLENITPEDFRFWEKIAYELSLNRNLNPTVKTEIIESPEKINLYPLPDPHNPFSPLDFLNSDEKEFEIQLRLSCDCGTKIKWSQEKCSSCNAKNPLTKKQQKMIFYLAEKYADITINTLNNISSRIIHMLREYAQSASQRFRAKNDEDIFQTKQRKKRFLDQQLNDLKPGYLAGRIKEILTVGGNFKSKLQSKMKSQFPSVASKIFSNSLTNFPHTERKINTLLIKNNQHLFQYIKEYSKNYKNLIESYIQIIPLLSIKKPKGFFEHVKIIGKKAGQKIWDKICPGAGEKRKKAKIKAQKKLATFKNKYQNLMKNIATKFPSLADKTQSKNAILKSKLNKSLKLFFIVNWIHLLEKCKSPEEKAEIKNHLNKIQKRLLLQKACDIAIISLVTIALISGILFIILVFSG